MGTYYIPRNVKGETRILYIFSIKSLITTGIGAVIGLPFYLIFVALGSKLVGAIILAVFAIIGFVIGAVKIPKILGIPFTKNVAGDSIDDVIVRYIKFKKDRKMYTYTKEEK